MLEFGTRIRSRRDRINIDQSLRKQIMLGDEPPIRNNFYSPKPEELFTAPNDADSTKEPS